MREREKRKTECEMMSMRDRKGGKTRRKRTWEREWAGEGEKEREREVHVDTVAVVLSWSATERQHFLETLFQHWRQTKRGTVILALLPLSRNTLIAKKKSFLWNKTWNNRVKMGAIGSPKTFFQWSVLSLFLLISFLSRNVVSSRLDVETAGSPCYEVSPLFKNRFLRHNCTIS